MKKLLIVFLFGLFFISLISGATTKVNKFGADFLITNDNFENFRNTLLKDYPECHNGKANITYKNYTRFLDMNCHIEFNNTAELTWTEATLNFDTYSDLLNLTYPMVVQQNNTIVVFNKVHIETIGNDSTYTIGMPTELYIGSCNSEAKNEFGLNNNYDSSTDFTIIGSSFRHNSYHINSSGLIGTSSSFLCNGKLNETLWINAKPSGLIYQYGGGFEGLTSSNSYLEKISSMISYMDVDLYSGSFTVKEAEDVTYNHYKTTYCFVPTGGHATGTFRDTIFKCGGTFSFGFGSETNFTVIDSSADTYLSGGFLATWIIDIYFTIKNDIKNRLGQPVYVDYFMKDTKGNIYSGEGTSIDEEILYRKYANTGNILYMPLNVTLINNTYLNIINHSWNMSTNNKGILPFQEIPYALELNPNSQYKMALS
jgi:hypothetical protein